MVRKRAAQSGDMEEDDAARVTARRERLGMTKVELAREAHVARTTLNALERGEGVQRSTLTKIERALDRLEEEMGVSAPPVPDDSLDLVTLEVQLPDGRIVRVVTKSTADAGRVAEQVAALLQRMSAQDK